MPSAPETTNLLNLDAVFTLLLVGVMILNLLAQLFVRRIGAGMAVIALQILGAVLGVLQHTRWR
jgi:hypothetical protein